MFVEDLIIIDADSALWQPARPIVEAALGLAQNDEQFTWHGWSKTQIETFLHHLPSHCTLLLGVWETEESGVGEQMTEQEPGETVEEHEKLILGVICEVVQGEVSSIRTFEALVDESLPPLSQLEPGYQHALALMQATRKQVAPVAWALFTDRETWQEWLFSQKDAQGELDKGTLLTSLAQQGRCVLMGSQTSHAHH